MKEIISKTVDILCINGECYANIIEEKEENERTWYDKFYLWYRQNFTIIILVLGCLLFASMIYYIWSKSNNKKLIQTGGDNEGGNTAKNLQKKQPKEKKEQTQGAISKRVDQYQSGTSSASAKGFKKLRQMGDKTGVTREALGKKTSAITGSIKEKSKAAWSSTKEGLKAAPGRIGDAISNNIQSFYTLLFSVGIVLGFAFFFMPTICMLVIGLLTYQITKNQVISMFTQ